MTEDGPARADRPRALLRRIKRGLARRVAITMTGWDTVRVTIEVAGLVGVRPRTYRLADPCAPAAVRADVVRVNVPDPAALGRLAASGLLHGRAADVRVRIERMPPWLRHGVTLPRFGRDTRAVSLRVRGAGAEIRVASRGRRDLAQRLTQLADGVRRARRWDRPGGDVYAIERADWLAGRAPSARGRADVAAVAEVADPAGAPPADTDAGATTFRPVPPTVTSAAGPPRWPLGTTIANPYGRRLLGTAERLRVAAEGAAIAVRRVADNTAWLMFDPARSAEHALLTHNREKYAVADLGETWPDGTIDGRFADHVLDVLAASGTVLAARSAPVRAYVHARGLPCVEHPDEVRDLAGYRHSVATANRAVVLGDETLRHTPLAGGTLELPTISALVASKRPDHLDACLGYLAAQTYPELEIVVGTHGYTLPAQRAAELAEKLPVPARFVPLPETCTLGEVLGTLSRAADGELLTKIDDDDPYGPDHLTDLVLARHTTGADLVAKSARFVYFAEADKTIDRTWAAPESFDVTPAGGTLLLSRGALDAAGGWSRSARHVDADLVARVHAAGGIMYRTHGLGYVYVRHAGGHTFRTDHAALLEQGESVWDGIPQPLLAAYDEPTDVTTRA